MRLNERANVAVAFVFFFAIIVGGLGIILLTPIMDEVENLQVSQIAAGDPVSTSRIATLNNLNTIWYVLPFIIVIMIGIWYWVQSLRTRDGWI